MQRNIHIKAICPYFEIYELVAENKAVRKLEKIKQNFHWYDSNSNFRKDNAMLSVTTGVHNPELPFKY